MLDSVYMQRVVLAPSARIFTAERLEDPSTSKILAPCKLPSLYAENPGGGGTLGISGLECAAGTLERFSYTRAS